jgi:cell division protein FtsW (lipid II flippase)
VLVVLRIVGLAVAAVLGFAVLAWIFTGDRKWLRIAWQVFKYAVFGLALILVLFAGEALLRG